jgi:hypothetical protein
VGFFLVLFFVPETKEKTLEELDGVFDVPLRRQAAFGAKQFVYFWRRYVFRQDVAKPVLPHDEPVGFTVEKDTALREKVAVGDGAAAAA